MAACTWVVARKRRDLRRAEAADSQNPGIPMQIGQAYLAMNRWQDAERSYLQAENIDELHPQVHLGLARCYLNLGKYQQAAEAASKAVGLRYHTPMAHYCYAQAQFRLQQHDIAEKSLNVALSQNPNFAEAYELLAEIAQWRKDDTQADEHRETAAELREMNKQRKLNRQQATLPNHAPIDVVSSLPKVPEVSPPEATDDPKVQRIPRLADPPVPAEFFADSEPREQYVTVVSGLPRSGTSMMMQMLQAAGLEPLTDGQREADENNPKGYFEFEAAKQLRDNPHWIERAQGKVTKVVAQLIPFLPQGFKYRVIFMERDIQEVIASQHKMLQRLEKQGATLDDHRIQNAYERQLSGANRLLDQHNIPLLSIAYTDAINNPESVVQQVSEFLNIDGAEHEMHATIDPALYRQRRSSH